MFELRETVTGELLQWQESLPPEKEEEPVVMPLLMRGWRLNDMVRFAMADRSFVRFLLERGVDWKEGKSGCKQRGEVAAYTYHASKGYGCDYLASAAVPYLSTQCEHAALSTVAGWRIYVEGGERWGFACPESRTRKRYRGGTAHKIAFTHKIAYMRAHIRAQAMCITLTDVHFTSLPSFNQASRPHLHPHSTQETADQETNHSYPPTYLLRARSTNPSVSTPAKPHS